jgi:hypothetical protein
MLGRMRRSPRRGRSLSGVDTWEAVLLKLPSLSVEASSFSESSPYEQAYSVKKPLCFERTLPFLLNEDDAEDTSSDKSPHFATTRV